MIYRFSYDFNVDLKAIINTYGGGGGGEYEVGI